MSLTCAFRAIARRLTETHLRCNAAILSSSRLHHNLVQNYQNSILQKQNRCLDTSISLQHLKNISLSSSRAAAGSHDHGKLWGAERLLSASLLGTVPIALLFPSQAMDSIIALSFVMHSHWGIEACVVDYVRPIIFGSVVPKVALGLVYVISISTLAGLFYLIFNDMGLANSILKLWKL